MSYLIKMAYISILSISGGSLYAQSFDCRLATSKTDMAICSKAELSRKESIMADLYSEIMLGGEYTKDLKSIAKLRYAEREACSGNEPCILLSLNNQIAEMSDLAGLEYVPESVEDSVATPDTSVHLADGASPSEKIETSSPNSDKLEMHAQQSPSSVAKPNPNIAVDESFTDSCKKSLRAVSAGIMEMEFPDKAAIGKVWRSIGVNPRYINNSFTSDSSLLEMINPTEYVASDDKMSTICGAYQPYFDKYINKSVSITSAGREVSYFFYFVDNDESNKIPGTWAINDSGMKRILHSSLHTLFVSYRHETDEVSGSTCKVSFHIFPGVGRKEAITSGQWTEAANVTKYEVFGMPVLVVEPKGEKFQSYEFSYLDSWGDVEGDLVAALNDSYSAFDNAFDWPKFEAEVKRSRSVGPIKIRDAASRADEPLVNSEACVTALKEARDKYAGASR